jgi:effector-binding domain-containing protein
MGFLDEMRDFWATLRRLGGHWRILGALVVLLGFGGFYLQKKLFPPPQAPVGASVPEAKSPDASTEGKAGAEGKGEGQKEAESPIESVSSQMVDVSARPTLVLKGEAKWEDAEKTIADDLAKLSAAASKAGLAAGGRPLAVFTETNDKGFHFEAMLPIAKAPDGKGKLADGVELGASPAGKALKFEHRGTYDEIDATYEAITAYLDEKGLDTKNLFIEEYLSDLSDAEDAAVEVDIYVFVK